MSPQKKTLLSNRLRRRLKQTGIEDFGEYYRHLKGLRPNDPEWDLLLQEITTHETYLFRDEAQWDWFRNTFLPQCASEVRSGTAQRSLRVWSAACSTGDEPSAPPVATDSAADPAIDYFKGLEDECECREKYLSIFIDETDMSLDQLTEALLALEGKGTLVMPEFDGLFALTGIISADPEARVVVVSALDQKSVLKEAFKLGAADFIVKPFDRSQLVDTLEQVVVGEETCQV